MAIIPRLDAVQVKGRKAASRSLPLLSHAALAIDEAQRAGLLDGERSEHLSFRVPKALLEAAQRELGKTSPTEVGIAALALLAQPDTFSSFMKRTHGRLGADHTLEY